MDLTRGLSPGLLAAVSGPSFHPAVAVYLDWPGLAIRAHSGAGAIAWDGENWGGVGPFGEVDIGAEGMSGLPADFSVAVSCDMPELAAYADAVVRNRPGSIYLGATTEPGGNVLVGDPTMLSTGTMDTLVLAVEFPDQDTIYRLAVGMRTGPGYRTSAAMTHSHEDQVGRYPTDTAGLMLRAALARAEKTLWPAP